MAFQGFKLSLWDSYGLADYELGAGSISEDAYGCWYLNICVKVKKAAPTRVVLSSAALGLDLRLKSFVSDSDGNTVEAQRFYRDLSQRLRRPSAPARRPARVHCMPRSLPATRISCKSCRLRRSAGIAPSSWAT